MSLWHIVLLGWLFAAALMAALWGVQRVRGNAGIVDVAWSFATALLGAWFAYVAEGLDERRLIVAAMVLVWGIRLGGHLWRRVASEREDGRYRRMREEWGASFQPKMFAFFQVQALWAMMFALPMLAAARNEAPLGWLDALGVLIWLVALTGESIADRQLARFRANPANRGQVCRAGLWRYSRHPNYFFEWLHWFAYLLLAAGSPWWWLALAGPVLMGASLVWFTGIPYVEAQSLRSRGDDYRRYQQETSVFFPWFPKRPSGDSGGDA
jgi:steroid 5-alpha reductase family enzyme